MMLPGSAHPRRPDEAQDRALAVRVQLLHREVLEDAALDLFEVVVVLVEHSARFSDIDGLDLRIAPRQLREPFQIGAQHRGLGAVLAHPLQALELLGGVLVHVLRHAGVADRLLQLRELGRPFLALAQLLLDLAHLLAQHVLALALVELLLRLVADLLRDAQHAEALGEQLQHLVQAPLELEGLKQVLLVLVPHVEEVRHHVGEQARRAHLLHHHRQLLRGVGEQLDRLDRALLQLQEARLDLGRHLVLGLDVLHARDEERPALEELEHAEAARALHHEVMRAFRAGDVAHHLAGGADPVEVVGPNVVLLGIALQEEADLLLAPYRFLRGRHGRLAADRDRRDHPGEQHRVAHRDDDHGVVGQRPARARLCTLRGCRRGVQLFLVRKNLLLLAHRPSFFRNIRVSTPSASVLRSSSSEAYGSSSGSCSRSSKRP